MKHGSSLLSPFSRNAQQTSINNALWCSGYICWWVSLPKSCFCNGKFITNRISYSKFITNCKLTTFNFKKVQLAKDIVFGIICCTLTLFYFQTYFYICARGNRCFLIFAAGSAYPVAYPRCPVVPQPLDQNLSGASLSHLERSVLLSINILWLSVMFKWGSAFISLSTWFSIPKCCVWRNKRGHLCWQLHINLQFLWVPVLSSQSFDIP